MIVNARVVDVSAQHAVVELQTSLQCSACSSGGGCGAGLFGQLPVALKYLFVKTCSSFESSPDGSESAASTANQTRTLRVRNPLHARPGDAVAVSLPDDVLPRLAWAGYFLPVLLLVPSIVAGHMLARFAGIIPDLGALAGLCVGGAGAFFIARSGGVLAYRKGYIGSVSTDAEIRQIVQPISPA